MATTARDLITWENGKYKRRPSSSESMAFQAISINNNNAFQAKNFAGTNVDIAKMTTGDVWEYQVVPRLATGLTPINPLDLVSKAYVDAMSAGLLVKDAVRLGTTVALDVTPAGSGVGKTLTANSGTYGAAEVSSVQAIGSTSDSLDGKYFLISSSTVSYYVWLDNSGSAIDPAPVGPTVGIKVILGTGNKTADEVATSIKAKLDADYPTVFSTTRLTDTLTITNVVPGIAADAAVGDSGFTVGTTTQGTAFGAFVLDGVSGAVVTNRILVKNQVDPIDNGIYTLTVAGNATTAWELTRAVDFDGSPASEVKGGNFTFIMGGTVNLNTGWVVTNYGPIAVDTNSITWTIFSAAGTITAGAGMVQVGQAFNVVAADNSLTVNADNMQVKVSDTGAVSVSAVSLHEGLKVNTDGSTIEITTNALNVKAAGITEVQIASSSFVSGGSIKGGSASKIDVDFAKTLTNDNAGSITIRQVVYIKSNGNVDLAIATNAALDASELAIVEPALIATTDSGKCVVKRGAIIGSYSGLTPGKKQYVDRTVAGTMVESLAGWVAGEMVYSVGRALSATELIFDPQFEFEY